MPHPHPGLDTFPPVRGSGKKLIGWSSDFPRPLVLSPLLEMTAVPPQSGIQPATNTKCFFSLCALGLTQPIDVDRSGQVFKLTTTETHPLIFLDFFYLHNLYIYLPSCEEDGIPKMWTFVDLWVIFAPFLRKPLFPPYLLTLSR